MRAVFVAFALLSTIACGSRSFSKGPLPERSQDFETAESDEAYQITDDAIAEALALRSQLATPFRLGVYFASDKWSSEQKDDILSLESDLKAAGLVSSLVYITPTTVAFEGQSSAWSRESNLSREERRAVRLAAARHGVDAVLIIHDGLKTNRANNPAALLYLTLVGGYLVPGTKYEATHISRAMLWDVRNEFLYLGAEAEAEKEALSPIWLLDEKKIENQAREKAAGELREELRRSLLALK